MTKDIEREAFEEAYSLAHKIFPSTLKKYADGSYYNGAVRAAWRWWQAAKAHESEKLKGCVVVPVKTPDQFTSKLEDHLLELWIGDWGCDWDGFVSVNGIKPENIWSMVVEAARGGNE